MIMYIYMPNRKPLSSSPWPIHPAQTRQRCQCPWPTLRHRGNHNTYKPQRDWRLLTSFNHPKIEISPFHHRFLLACLTKKRTSTRNWTGRYVLNQHPWIFPSRLGSTRQHKKLANEVRLGIGYVVLCPNIVWWSWKINFTPKTQIRSGMW